MKAQVFSCCVGAFLSLGSAFHGLAEGCAAEEYIIGFKLQVGFNSRKVSGYSPDTSCAHYENSMQSPTFMYGLCNTPPHSSETSEGPVLQARRKTQTVSEHIAAKETPSCS